jgi:cytochrome d ubiquinol oxidase subunit I
MVALGSVFSAIWIIVANSWQQSPVGSVVGDSAQGPRAVIVDFWAVVLSPTSINHLVHAVLGAFILGAFFVMSVSAHYVLRRRHLDIARKAFTLALVFGAFSSVAIAVSGHFQGRVVARTQPAKIAAMEGHFETGVADLHLFGWPDAGAGRVRYGVAIPGSLSFLIHNSFSAPVPGLREFPEDARPPVAIPFLSYHVMVGLGTAFIALTLLGLYFRWRGTLFEKRWLMGVFVVAVLGPFLANEAGWVATEVGRQPFVVYPQVTWDGGVPHMQTEGPGPVLRTRDGLSGAAAGTPGQVVGSIAMFSFIYLLLFAVWLYVLNSKIQHGPDEVDVPAPAATSAGDLLEAAARLANPSGYSMTMACQEQTEQTP